MDEFNVRLASNVKNKKYNVFKLHKDDQVAWNEAKMRRENDYQPWQIKFGNGKTSRRFKAIKEGGVGDNASYFVFYKTNDKSDTYEVCPVEEWYNVSATQRYKTLTAEEAEELFEKRDKMFNFGSIMKKSGENDEDGPAGSDSKNFKVTELDDWSESGDDDRSDEDGDGDNSKKKNRKKKNIKKEEPDDAPEEGKEDSDEGDFEQREVDYMSDSSSDSSVSEADRKDETDVKGIAEEQALRELLSSEEEEEEDANNPQRKPVKTIDLKRDADENASDDSSDSDDYDVDDEKMDSMLMDKGFPTTKVKQEADQLQLQPQPQQQQQQQQQQHQPSTSVKRKVLPDTAATTAPKRPCVDVPANSQEKLVEDLIKKYLSRKPMTLKNLLKDIRSKLRRMDGMTPEMDGNLVNMIASIMKRLGPDKQKINDHTYFSIKN